MDRVVDNGNEKSHTESYYGLEGLDEEHSRELEHVDMGMDGGEEEEEDGDDGLKGQNGRSNPAAGMHKCKNVRNHMGRDKEGDDVDLDLVVGMEEGMHRDCGLGMKMMNRNYPLTNH